MPRHGRPGPPVVPASLAVGVLGAAVLGGALTPTVAAGTDRAVTPAALVAPVPDAILPPPVSVRPREAITDVGL